jgi:hypothetical protein
MEAADLQTHSMLFTPLSPDNKLTTQGNFYLGRNRYQGTVESKNSKKNDSTMIRKSIPDVDLSPGIKFEEKEIGA